MDMPLDAKDQAFRDEVRGWLDANLPADLRLKGERSIEFTRDEQLRWMRILSKKGWIAPNWPKEAGGTDWTALQKLLFEVECYDAGAPRFTNFGTQLVGPVLLHYGSPEQKAQHIPPILNSDLLWCQGYSEPGSGSDLASLKTRAVRDGDDYIVDGSKIWTSSGHWAKWMFCLTRTSSAGKKQEGITFLLIDMDTPGITVQPIYRINGLHEFNQVFLEGVRVPVSQRVGAEGEGWTIAKYLLGHERSGAAAGFGMCARLMRQVKEVAAAEPDDGRVPLARNRAFAARIGQMESQLMSLWYSAARSLSAASADKPVGPESSLLKLRGTEIQQDLTELLMEAVGYYAQPYHLSVLKQGWGNEPSVGPDYAAPLAPNYLDWRKASIYGGTSEVQKNIIAKAVLGL